MHVFNFFINKCRFKSKNVFLCQPLLIQHFCQSDSQVSVRLPSLVYEKRFIEIKIVFFVRRKFNCNTCDLRTKIHHFQSLFHNGICHYCSEEHINGTKKCYCVSEFFSPIILLCKNSLWAQIVPLFSITGEFIRKYNEYRNNPFVNILKKSLYNLLNYTENFNFNVCPHESVTLKFVW